MNVVFSLIEASHNITATPETREVMGVPIPEFKDAVFIAGGLALLAFAGRKAVTAEKSWSDYLKPKQDPNNSDNQDGPINL